MRTDTVTVGLLSHYFDESNLGCVALSISNVMILEQAAKRAGVEVSYIHLINERTSNANPPLVSGGWKVRQIPSTSAACRRPWSLARTTALQDCDLVLNINAGDGFTSIYGLRRQISESYMSLTAINKSKPLMLAPQTVGPFTTTLSRLLASSVLRKAEVVFARDLDSAEIARALGARTTCREVVDVAFALPYVRPKRTDLNSARKVGVNVSGLLWRGGYDGDNFFGLNFSYRDYALRLVRGLLERGIEVHLIGHVFSPGGVEDDLSAGEQIAESWPNVCLAPPFTGPEEAKSYIAQMDAFTGARMHATIAAISSGVPVVPFGYSDKVRGLYQTLGYEYYVDARDGWTAESAAECSMRWLVEEREELRMAARGAHVVWSKALFDYENALANLLRKHARTA